MKDFPRGYGLEEQVSHDYVLQCYLKPTIFKKNMTDESLQTCFPSNSCLCFLYTVVKSTKTRWVKGFILLKWMKVMQNSSCNLLHIKIIIQHIFLIPQKKVTEVTFSVAFLNCNYRNDECFHVQKQTLAYIKQLHINSACVHNRSCANMLRHLWFQCLKLQTHAYSYCTKE